MIDRRRDGIARGANFGRYADCLAVNCCVHIVGRGQVSGYCLTISRSLSVSGRLAVSRSIVGSSRVVGSSRIVDSGCVVGSGRLSVSRSLAVSGRLSRPGQKLGPRFKRTHSKDRKLTFVIVLGGKVSMEVSISVIVE